VRGDIPDGAIAVGVPARVIGRVSEKHGATTRINTPSWPASATPRDSKGSDEQWARGHSG
jgi:hypothetical protein